MTIPSQRKSRVFLILGILGLLVGSIALTRLHLDFAGGFGYAFGLGALITSIVLMRRGPTTPEPDSSARR